MRGISWFVDILHDRSKLLRLKLTNLFPNINFSSEKDSGKVLIIIIILFLIIILNFSFLNVPSLNSSKLRWNFLWTTVPVKPYISLYGIFHAVSSGFPQEFPREQG